MIPLIKNFFEYYNPHFQLVYFLLAWGLLGVLIATIIGSIVSVGKQSKTMHQIPCTNCKYFTGSYYLKCSVNPHIANTELAIDCIDFRQK